MKGLLLKDIYTLTKQMRFFLLMVVFMAVMPGGSMVSFAIVYAGMLPYTALAYDERSRWNELARMMPYTTRQLVLSKYAMGWIAIGGAAALSVVGCLLTALAGGKNVLQTLATLPALVGISATMMAATLPLMFRYGVEKGRILFITLLIATAYFAMTLAGQTLSSGPVQGEMLLGIGLLFGLPLLGVLAQAVSIPLSTRLFERQRG